MILSIKSEMKKDLNWMWLKYETKKFNLSNKNVLQYFSELD